MNKFNCFFLFIRKNIIKMLPIEKRARKAGVKIGKNCFINSCFWKNSEAYLITIGDNCGITSGTLIFTHGGGRAVRGKYPLFDTFGKVKIGNNVYIGTNSLIMPGVTIEDNVLIAAGSVVTKSIPSNMVVAGNPAHIICTIDTFIERNSKYNINSKKLSKKEKEKLLLTLGEDKFITKKFMKLV